MEDALQSLLFFDELSPKRREELRRQIEDDPDLADALSHWKEVHRQVRRRFRETLPDRRLLVLYALDQSGRGDLLDATEREALDAARPDLEAAIERHPSLQDVIATIQDELTDFEATWEEHGITVASEDAPAADVGTIDETVGATDDAQPRARQDRSPRTPERSTSRLARRVAAGALLVFAGMMAWFLWPGTTPTNTVTVADGTIQRINLVDGSTVRLVGAAEMVYTKSTGEAFNRRVTLNYGRAFFNIQEQKRPKPFIVETPTATATALGTQFGVAASADSTDVILASGKVEVDAREEAGEGSVVLEPGQHSRVVRGAAPSAPQSVDVAAALEWSGLFVFRDTAVESIAERLRTFYGLSISVDESLQGEPVTGTFDQNQDPERILDAIASTLGARVEGSEEDGYRLVSTE